MSLTIRIETIAYWCVALAIIVSENLLYVVSSNTSIMGINILDIGFLLVAGLAVLIMLMLKDEHEVQYRFRGVFLFTIIMVITSSMQSNILYGQSFWLGIRPQRTFLLWALLYFPIRKCMALGIITYDGFEKLIYRIGILELILYIGQFLVGDYVTFLHVLSNNVYSTSRYYFNTIFLCLLLFICLDKVFKRERILFNLCIIVAVIFEILIVGKMRLNFIAVIVAIACGLIIWRNGGTTKILIIIAGIAGLAMLSSNEVVSSIIPALNRTSSIDTLAIRDSARAFYLSVLAEHPILGGGYINTDWYPSVVGSGVNLGYGWVDNGIFGFAFLNGLLGVAWFIYLLFRLYKNAYYILKNDGTYLFFVMPIYWIVSCVNEAHWYFCSFLVVSLLICMMECYLDRIEYRSMG